MSGLPPKLRRRLEDCFGTDLGAIVLHIGPAATEFCRRHRARGACHGDHIVLAGTDPEDPGLFQTIVHEAAHVLQKRRCGLVDEPAAEAEAGAAVRAAITGRRIAIRASSSPMVPSFWQEVGHYYTVYATMLAAGAPIGDAAMAAFFAQLPDEVDELDASNVGKDYLYQEFVTPFSMVKQRYTNTQTLPVSPFVDPAIAALNEQRFNARVVQEGLHALTGQPQQKEITRRKNIVETLDISSSWFLVDFGLACHALGDTFAHEKNGRMYKFPEGHLFDFHEPDLVTADNWEKYISYLEFLYEAVRSKYGNRPTRRPLEALKKDLRPLVILGIFNPNLGGIFFVKKAEKKQAEFIRQVTKSFPDPCQLLDYEPIDDPRRPMWKVAKQRSVYFKSWSGDQVVRRALELARTWRN